MDDIIGIYTGEGAYSIKEGGPDPWYPKTIKVNMVGADDLNGTYTQLTSGGGGVVYLNEGTDTVLKVKWYSYEGDTEVKYQKMVGDLAPDIFYESFREVRTDIDGKVAFGGDKVSVIIMEYLNPDEWAPMWWEVDSTGQSLSSTVNITGNINKLFETIYQLIFKFNLKNTIDFIGNTGPHLFINEITGKIKIIDYGSFKPSDDHKNDFMEMIKDIQDHGAYIPRPTDKDIRCYGRIMDLTNDVTEPECHDYMLYKGRLFLEGKSQPPVPEPSRPRTRSATAMEESERGAKRFKKGGRKKRTKKRKKSNRKNRTKKSKKSKKSKSKRKNSKKGNSVVNGVEV